MQYLLKINIPISFPDDPAARKAAAEIIRKAGIDQFTSDIKLQRIFENAQPRPVDISRILTGGIEG